MHRAIFMDRDGVINEIIYHQEMGIIDSPFTVEQFCLLPQVAEAINLINRMGFKAVVISNQPGIAKNHFSHETLARVDEKMKGELASGGAYLDAIYYCLHHPQASNVDYRKECDCRKPRAGMLLRSARRFSLDLTKCHLIGDAVSDVQAAWAVGCQPILVRTGKGRESLPLLRHFEGEPTVVVDDLSAAVDWILSQDAQPRPRH